MATAPNLCWEPDPEKARVADRTNYRLRQAGFPEAAITSWWMLLTDAEVGRTPYRVWESGEFGVLDHIVAKTIKDRDTYRSLLGHVTSRHWADRLAQSHEVQDRLLGGLKT